MNIRMEDGWKQQLSGYMESPSFQGLTQFVRSEYQTTTCYPPGKLIFSAFDHCPLDSVKVVIIGQDPYHGPGQANGLCFSVAPGTRIPPSLVNIFKEILRDLGTPAPVNGDLSRWADQGVLLLNAVLTVRAHAAASHQGKGWEQFTDEVIRVLNSQKENLVFMLWGAYAQRKGAFIDNSRHLVLKSAHPSPLSAHNGFHGNNHFSQANKYLASVNKTPVIW